MEGKSQSMEWFKQLLLQEINLWLEILFHIDQANKLDSIISLQNYCFLYNVLSLTLETFPSLPIMLPQMVVVAFLHYYSVGYCILLHSCSMPDIQTFKRNLILWQKPSMLNPAVLPTHSTLPPHCPTHPHQSLVMMALGKQDFYNIG